MPSSGHSAPYLPSLGPIDLALIDRWIYEGLLRYSRPVIVSKEHLRLT
jgi:hypothetical protein